MTFKTFFTLVACLLIAIVLMYLLNYLGVFKITDKPISIPGTDVSVILAAPCLDKKINGTYKVYFEKHRNEDPFLIGMKPCRIFYIDMAKNKCQIVGDGYQKSIRLVDLNTNQVIEDDIEFTIPVKISGNINNDTLTMDFIIMESNSSPNVWKITCVERNPTLDRFIGKIFNRLDEEVGQAVFEKVENTKSINSDNQGVENTQKAKEVNNDKLNLNVIRNEKAIDVNPNVFYLLPKKEVLKINSKYMIQIAAKSTIEEVNFLVDECKGVLGTNMVLYMTNERRNMYKLFVRQFDDYEKAQNFQYLLRENYPDIGELGSAWVVFSNDLIIK